MATQEVIYDAGVVESAPDVVELALIGKTSPLELFTDKGLDPIIEKIRAEVKKHVSDISTEPGRKAIASLSRKVASSKVRLDDLGKELVYELKTQTSAIDAERKRMRDELDRLRDETRQPLTEWENTEKSRLQGHEDGLKTIADLANVPFNSSIEDMEERLETVHSFAVRDWQEFAQRYKIASETAIGQLTKLVAETKRRAEEQSELRRLQEAEAKRLQEERDARIQAEAAARATAEAQAKARKEAEAEELRQAEAAAKAKQAAEQRIRQAEENAAKEKAESERKAKDAQESADKAKREAEQAIAKAKAETEAATQRERERVAEAKRKEDAETAKRESDKKHKAKINSDAVHALAVNCYLTEENAKLVIIAIAKGQIPAVRIVY
jgi:hypothetical protein